MIRKSVFKITGIFSLCLLAVALFLSFIFTDKENAQSAIAQAKGFFASAGGKAPDAGSNNPSIPSTYIFAAGDTLDSIASKFGISMHAIVIENRIDDERKLIPGDSIRLAGIPRGAKKPKNGNPLIVDSTTESGIVPLFIGFAFSKTPPEDCAFVWDFGNGIYSFDEEPSHTYMSPGTYAAICVALTGEGEEIKSGPITIVARPFNLKSDGLAYIVADYVNSVIDLSGRVTDASGNPVVFGGDTRIVQKPHLIEPLGMNLFAAVASGYSMVTLVSGSSTYTFDLFVSPFPTKHSVEPEFDWYKTQFDTGIWGNCGPACVAMVVHWATGKAITVEESREEIGMPYPKGALSYDNMLANFKLHKLTAFKKKVEFFDDIAEVIDRGQVALILFDTTYIHHVKGDKTRVFTDRYYPDTTGHYVVIKGYSLDRKYYVVYDPIPGDWQENEPRYTDGVSMIGRNRYFQSDEILESIRNKEILVIARL
jgi:hypothetical protein